MIWLKRLKKGLGISMGNRLTREEITPLIEELRKSISMKRLMDFPQPRMEHAKAWIKEECIRLGIYDENEDGDFNIRLNNFFPPIYIQFMICMPKSEENTTWGYSFTVLLQYKWEGVSEIDRETEDVGGE